MPHLRRWQLSTLAKQNITNTAADRVLCAHEETFA